MNECEEEILSRVRIPYVVGRWVRGQNHYGRTGLLEYLLRVEDSATWLVGTRRMGKTSLLRQLELATSAPECSYVPVFWDLQGCTTSYDLSYELFVAFDEVRERFTPFDIDIESLANLDAIAMLRRVNRQLARNDRRLLLLIDEAEALLEVAADEPEWLARLRKVLQEGRQRTVMTSTKLLARLNTISATWTTSPFLFGFNLTNLWKLDMAASTALVRQLQSENPVSVDDQILEDILIHTNGHPYLIQLLCQRLFTAGTVDGGRLRSIRDGDLATDHILSGFFQIDFQYLTVTERRLLLTVAELTVAKEREILAALSDESPTRLQMFLYGLEKLGYLRQVFGQWSVGNEFLRRWIQDNHVVLCQQSDAMIDDDALERILVAGRRNEREYLEQELVRLEAELAELIEQRNALGEAASDELLARIEQVRVEIKAIREALDKLIP